MQPSLSPTVHAAVESWFVENFTLRGDLGAAVSIWQDGVEVLHLCKGSMARDKDQPWTPDTLVPVWSATKGPAAVACLLALHEGGLSLNTPVIEIWPEFFVGGKDRITFGHVLCHRAGLCALKERVPIFDYNAVIHAIEHQAPLWPACDVQAYHARTYGFILDEIVRRITGVDTLGHWFDEVVGKHLGMDFWIGLPPELNSHVATLYPGKLNLTAGDQAFGKAFNTPGSLTHRTFASPMGLNAVADFNQPHTWAQGYASMGGVGSARALAKFYGMLANGGKHNGEQLIPTWIIQALGRPLSEGDDAVLCVPMAFSAGMMMDPIDPETNQKKRSLFGPNEGAFGHAGAGGSLAFGDPDSGYSFAYVMNQMEVGVLPSDKAQGLVRALYSEW
jgi:CubicO group peptidase (beta-lactamase class C family)